MIRFNELPQGDDRVLLLRAQDTNGDPVDLTGASLRVAFSAGGRVLETSRSGQVDALVDLGADPAQGDYTVTLTAGRTASWPTGPVVLEVKALLGSGRRVTLLRDAQVPLVASAIRDEV